MAFEFCSVLEHWEGEGDDGDVEDGAEYIACAWCREVMVVGTVGVEELDVARFGAVGIEGGGEAGAFGEGEEPD